MEIPLISRIVSVDAAQLGPVALDETRAQVVERRVALLEQARQHRCDLWSCFRNSR